MTLESLSRIVEERAWTYGAGNAFRTKSDRSPRHDTTMC
jgi:hypothetical protein